MGHRRKKKTIFRFNMLDESTSARMIAALPGVTRLAKETKGAEDCADVYKAASDLKEQLESTLVKQFGSKETLALVLRTNRIMYKLK